jgi:hypothetical protein
MKYRIADTPNPRQWPIGRLLTIGEAAQLLEVNAGKMAARSRAALALVSQGFRIEIIHEAGDRRADDDDLNEGTGWRPGEIAP